MLLALVVDPDHGALVGRQAGIFIHDVIGKVEVFRHLDGEVLFKVLHAVIVRTGISFNEIHALGLLSNLMSLGRTL